MFERYAQIRWAVDRPRVSGTATWRVESIAVRSGEGKAMLKPFSNLLAAMAFIVSPVSAFAAPPGGADIAIHVERDGNAFMVAAELTVAASTDEVWEVLTDFDHMAQILSSVDFSRVANRNGKRFDVIQKSHGSAGLIHVSLDSVRAVELTPKREIRSHLTTGDLKSSDFTTRIAKKGGVTRITVRGKIVAEGLSAAVPAGQEFAHRYRVRFRLCRVVAAAPDGRPYYDCEVAESPCRTRSLAQLPLDRDG